MTNQPKEKKGVLYVLWRAVRAVSDLLVPIATTIAGVAGGVMLISLLCGVFSRMIPWIKPFIWTEEVARMCMLWMTMNAASVVFKKKELVRFGFIIDHMSYKKQRVMNLIYMVIIGVFLFVFLKYGYSVMMVNKRIKLSATKIPQFYPSLGLYIGGVFMAVHLVEQFLYQLLHWSKPENVVKKEA